MPSKKITESYSQPLTWENIGLQFAKTQKAKDPAIAIQIFLNTLDSNKTNLGDLFQKYVGDTIPNLSIKMREIISQITFQQNLSDLNINATVYEKEIRNFIATLNVVLIGEIEGKAILVDEKSKNLQLPAIGIYSVNKVLQISIYKCFAKINPLYKKIIKDELVKAKEYLNSLRNKGIEFINASFVLNSRTHYGSNGEIDFAYTGIFYENILLKRVVTFKNGEETNLFPETFLAKFKTDKIAEFDKNIFKSAMAIIDKL
jgi:hypothetical protein